jgi:hypothetical protein
MGRGDSALRCPWIRQLPDGVPTFPKPPGFYESFFGSSDASGRVSKVLNGTTHLPPRFASRAWSLTSCRVSGGSVTDLGAVIIRDAN